MAKLQNILVSHLCFIYGFSPKVTCANLASESMETLPRVKQRYLSIIDQNKV